MSLPSHASDGIVSLPSVASDGDAEATLVVAGCHCRVMLAMALPMTMLT
jgi:hypothetical protein